MVIEEVTMPEDIVEDKEVETEGVELDSGGVAWAGFDSSHWPFSA